MSALDRPLYEALDEFRNAKDKNASFEYFFFKFEPLLKKYALALGESDYVYFLAEPLYNALLKMPIELERFREDRFIISYIQKSIYCEYVLLSKALKENANFTVLADSNEKEEYSMVDSIGQKEFDMFLTEALAKLTRIERRVFYYRLVAGYSETETGAIMAVSQQAVSKNALRLKRKLHAFFKEHYFY